jgi:hypothetical protein
MNPTPKKTIRQTIDKLPKEFLNKYNLLVFKLNDKEYLSINLNSINLPFPTDISTNGVTWTFKHDKYNLTLWIEVKSEHLLIF